MVLYNLIYFTNCLFRNSKQPTHLFQNWSPTCWALQTVFSYHCFYSHMCIECFLICSPRTEFRTIWKTNAACATARVGRSAMTPGRRLSVLPHGTSEAPAARPTYTAARCDVICMWRIARGLVLITISVTTTDDTWLFGGDNTLEFYWRFGSPANLSILATACKLEKEQNTDGDEGFFAYYFDNLKN